MDNDLFSTVIGISKKKKTTYVSIIVYTFRNVQLLIRKSWKNIWYRATGGLPFLIIKKLVRNDNQKKKKRFTSYT